MNTWSRAHLFRIVLPFAFGILAAIHLWPLTSIAGIIGLGIASGIYFFIHLLYKRLGYRLRLLSGAALFLLCFMAGMACVGTASIRQRPDFFAKLAEKNDVLLLKLSEPLIQKEKSMKGIFQVVAIIRNGKEIPTEGKTLIYLQKDPASLSLHYGDDILVPNHFKAIAAPRNPGEFDLKAYMGYRQVFHTAYFNTGIWQACGRNEGQAIWKVIYALKKKVRTYFEEQLTNKDERGIADALILGDTDELQPEIISAYAGTGTLHVLSVSGLHVGVIVMVLRWLLSFLSKSRSGRIIRMLLLLVLLWAYAFITGLSPSVCRSVAMFSFVVIGLNFRPVTNIYNSIATSALVLLLWDPFMIMQVGFQLSYIALIGIVWLQPKVAAWWTPPKSWFARKGWEIISASIAAQLITLPISLYYFNQFPTYFLLSNLVIIPYSTIVLGAGALFILIRIIPFGSFIHVWAGKRLYDIIHGLNWVAQYIAHLPQASLNGIYLSGWQCMVLYTAVCLLCFALIYKQKRLLQWGLAFTALLFGLRLADVALQQRQPQLIVHAVPKNLLISVKAGDRLWLLGDSDFVGNADKIKFYLQRYAFQEYVSDANIQGFPLSDKAIVRTPVMYFHAPLGQAGKNSFLILREKEELDRLPANLPQMAFVILDRNPKLNMGDLAEKVRFKALLFSPDNSNYRISRWTADCNKMRIPYHDLRNDSSFALSL